MSNPETALTLDEAIAEVLGLLTGLDLQYVPESDRYGAITRQINRAMRACAVEREWSFYSDLQSIGVAAEGEQEMLLPSTLRPRIINDDAVRLLNEEGRIARWAYFLPRDALHKYAYRAGLWVAVTRQTLQFSRPFFAGENGWTVQVPVMREPTMFRLPPQPEDPTEASVPVPEEIREQEIDFPYPDLVVLRAAFYYAQTDPVMQPRVQTLEAQYKDMMYQIIERDERNTDSPEQTRWSLSVQSGLTPDTHHHLHPHADGRI